MVSSVKESCSGDLALDVCLEQEEHLTIGCLVFAYSMMDSFHENRPVIRVPNADIADPHFIFACCVYTGGPSPT